MSIVQARTEIPQARPRLRASGGADGEPGLNPADYR